MNNNSKNNNKNTKLQYEILGNAFIGDLFNLSGDLDNTTQNLITYVDSEQIQKSNKENKHRR